MTKETLIETLRRRVNLAGTAYRAAADLDVSDSHLSDVLKGRREPGPKLLKALKLEKIVTYRRTA
jgi:hypothetical protein